MIPLLTNLVSDIKTSGKLGVLSPFLPPSCYIVHTNVSQMWIRGVVERLLNAAHSWQTTCYLLLTRASTDESGEFTPRHLLTFHTGGGANIFVSHVGRSLSYQAEFANCGAPALRKKNVFNFCELCLSRCSADLPGKRQILSTQWPPSTWQCASVVDASVMLDRYGHGCHILGGRRSRSNVRGVWGLGNRATAAFFNCY